jgi:hypothetical protein
MVNDALNMLADPCDFRLKRRDTRFEFPDRHRVQILPGQCVQRIARPTREILFGLHAPSVDRGAGRVNKPKG